VYRYLHIRRVLTKINSIFAAFVLPISDNLDNLPHDTWVMQNKTTRWKDVWNKNTVDFQPHYIDIYSALHLFILSLWSQEIYRMFFWSSFFGSFGQNIIYYKSLAKKMFLWHDSEKMPHQFTNFAFLKTNLYISSTYSNVNAEITVQSWPELILLLNQ